MAANTTEKQAATPAAPEPLADGPKYTPLVDILETNDGYTIYADLPGAQPSDLDVTYENDTLMLEGKVSARQPPEQQYLVKEYGVGNYSRSFRISAPVESEGIRAELKNGVLCLFVPKAESAKVRKIPITSGV